MRLTSFLPLLIERSKMVVFKRSEDISLGADPAFGEVLPLFFLLRIIQSHRPLYSTVVVFIS